MTLVQAPRNSLLIAGALIAALAGYWSVRLAWADWLSTSSDSGKIAQAVQLSPGNAAFRVKLANVIQKNGGDPSRDLIIATRLNPTDAQVWMRLALMAEMHGDFQKAENDLLLATQASHQFEPRWTAANYYCRRNDLVKFWPTVRQALSVGYPDVNPVFALCWSLSQDSREILSRAIPKEHTVLSAYLQYLLRSNHAEAAAGVAAVLVPVAAASDRDVLLAWCSRALREQEVAASLNLWNTMCRRGLLPYAALDPPRGVSLTDGGFTSDLDGGFAWHLQSAPGLACGRNRTPRYLWISFYGNQATDCVPLAQYLPIEPAARYRLKFEYRTSDVLAESGLRWHVLDPAGRDLTPDSPQLSSPQWRSDEVLFTAPGTGSLARLTLRYQRAVGAPRLEGSILLRAVALERIS